jgi:two-component system, response regulator, stage 0 sporulation protein F
MIFSSPRQDYRQKRNSLFLQARYHSGRFPQRPMPDFNSFQDKAENLKKRVLVVDDNVELLEALKDVLEDEYDLEFATNGKEALLRLEEHIPTVILMDYKMPGMDGLETLRCIRSQAPSVPVIMMSAYPEECSIGSAISHGADFYLNKPFDLIAIRDAIEKIAP